jgi:signal transduction histidine kinase
LTAAVEVAAFRIAVEGLTNAVRHAGATTCRVRFDATDAGALRIDITDDGRGLPAVVVPGVGLDSMRERAEELGGTMVVEAGGDGGTRVVARLPLAPVPRPAPRSVARADAEPTDADALPAPEAHRA